MAYKFQSGLARLGGEVHMDSALLVSGSVNLADKSLPIADLDVNEGTNLGPNAAHTDELIIHDADADATKKIRVVDLGQYLSGSDPTFLQVNQATQAASGSFRVVGHSISGSAALEVVGQSFLQGKVNASGAIEAEGSITAGSSFIIGSADLNEADMEKLDGITNGTVAASKAVVVNATKDATKDYYVINGYALRYCKACTNEKHLKRLHKLSVEARLLRSAKSRAQRNNLEFDISIDDIIVPEVCPILGIQLNKEVSQRGGQSDSPSIDRIDSSKGYVKGNIWVISLKANRNKGDFTLSQLENMVKLIKKHMAKHQ